MPSAQVPATCNPTISPGDLVVNRSPYRRAHALAEVPGPTRSLVYAGTIVARKVGVRLPAHRSNGWNFVTSTL
ncbi:MAG: hypothetical protein ACPG4T_00955, partial [Nannocystaceae bacterium]